MRGLVFPPAGDPGSAEESGSEQCAQDGGRQASGGGAGHGFRGEFALRCRRRHAAAQPPVRPLRPPVLYVRPWFVRSGGPAAAGVAVASGARAGCGRRLPGGRPTTGPRGETAGFGAYPPVKGSGKLPP
ncbi:hypothetical protein GCM10010336_46720 [Streptomyces goshikiensis]|nr:hypothetical protein GCM10010336_46720 [Streptomyces goshikiensis]